MSGNVCPGCNREFSTPQGLGVHFSHGLCSAHLEPTAGEEADLIDTELAACVRAIGNHARRIYAIDVEGQYQGAPVIQAQPVYQALVELMEEVLVELMGWTPEQLQEWVKQSNEMPQ